jgi:hypothetical protein
MLVAGLYPVVLQGQMGMGHGHSDVQVHGHEQAAEFGKAGGSGEGGQAGQAEVGEGGQIGQIGEIGEAGGSGKAGGAGGSVPRRRFDVGFGGLGGKDVHGVENVDLTSLVHCHSDYPQLLPTIMGMLQL